MTVTSFRVSKPLVSSYPLSMFNSNIIVFIYRMLGSLGKESTNVELQTLKHFKSILELLVFVQICTNS